ncbi:hypothetical protein H6F67_05570 [Microcoleus sp. FACHB-1515]|uniref:hypothetical protein n=1 Tax=Cyanophyceae TaxID=3028117 RepID=UPI00168A3CE9|nr:hypothetical protein [Microcoleus sp. FACHB-1515]MBD2089320.1 hypothetical protein [Microcoleus sp. FACHB-1515]
MPLKRFLSLACLSVTAALALSVPARSQSLSVPDEELQPQQSDLRPLTQDGSLLSMQGGQRLMNEASAAVNAQNYDLAVSKLQDARQVYNQLSNFYQQLAASFSGIDNRITESQRQQALQAAQMRDQATYQLALVHRAQNRPELAVPLLVQIIRSQQPTRDLGQQAYRQLYELGFVDSPFPRDSGSTSSAPAPATSATPIQSSQPLN